MVEEDKFRDDEEVDESEFVRDVDEEVVPVPHKATNGLI